MLKHCRLFYKVQKNTISYAKYTMPKLQMTSSGQKTEYNTAAPWMWGLTAAVSLMACSESCYMEESKQPQEIMQMEEMQRYLKDHLMDFRHRIFKAKGLPEPRIKMAHDAEKDTSYITFAGRGNRVAAINGYLSELQPSGTYTGESVKVVFKPDVQQAAVVSEGDRKKMLPLNLILSYDDEKVEIKISHHTINSWIFVVRKQGLFKVAEVKALVAAYKNTWQHAFSDGSSSPVMFAIPRQAAVGTTMGGGPNDAIEKIESKDDALAALDKLGVKVFEPSESSKTDLTWEAMAGYDDIKTDIQDTLILALQHPEVYDDIARKTRVRFESNRPRAVLFEGPPGTGKTLSARIIAQQTGVPLVHVKLENILSKYYGEATKNMATIFRACDQLDGAIIFIDEVDALAGNRAGGSGMHEASRRILSVMLQKMEGFEENQKTTILCATNRKKDLDAALLSRFGLSITFTLPDQAARQAIFQRYAKHLSNSCIEKLGSNTEGLSCRDIKEMCEQTERRWAAKVIRHNTQCDAPSIDEYMNLITTRDHTWHNSSPLSM